MPTATTLWALKRAAGQEHWEERRVVQVSFPMSYNEYKWRLDVTAPICENFPMHSLDNDELAATALAWRRRACQGEPGACDVAQRLEIELERRLGAATTLAMPFELEPQPIRQWWRRW